MKADANGTIRLNTRDWISLLTIAVAIAGIHWMSTARISTQIHDAELRWVERIAEVKNEIEGNIPPPEVRLRLDRIEQRQDTIEEKLEDLMALPGYNPKGHQDLDVVSTATALTVAAGSKVALIQCEGQDVRWRDDGTSPTAAIGMRLYAGAAPFLYTGNLDTIEFIQVGATATMNINYYG